MPQDSVRVLKPFQIFSEGLAVDADFTPKPIEEPAETQASPATDPDENTSTADSTTATPKAETLSKVAKD